MRPIRPIATIAAVAALSACLGGCAIPAWMAAQFGPEEKIPAEFEPPAGKTILVLVEDRGNPINYDPVKLQLTDQINQQLLAHKIASNTIDYKKIGDLLTREPNANSLAVSEIGARLGADMVLYVHIDKFGLRDPDASEELWKGRLQTTIRLVDVQKGRLWPVDKPDGQIIPEAETQTVSDNSPERAELVSKELAVETAEKIAKLFYAHSQPYEGAYGDKTRNVID